MRTIVGLDRPQGAFCDVSTNRLFVASGGDGTVRICGETTFQLLQTVKVSAYADNMHYDSRRKRVLVDYAGEKFLSGKLTRSGRRL